MKNAKQKWVMKRVHGKELKARWDGKGMPPIHKKPPHRGMPQLERTHPFHFKMSPGPMLGPLCNHDVGILLKLPILDSAENVGANKPPRSSDPEIAPCSPP